MNNVAIRNVMKDFNLKQWQLAQILGVREESLSRKMRHEIPVDEQRRIIALVKGTLVDEEYVKESIQKELDRLYSEYGNYQFFFDMLKEFAEEGENE